MEDFFKYSTPGADDKNWGLYLTVAGKATITSQSFYPSSKHPTGYYFTWKKGRILEEYQLVYITHGSGVLEIKQGKYNVKPGSILLIPPGEQNLVFSKLHRVLY